MGSQACGQCLLPSALAKQQHLSAHFSLTQGSSSDLASKETKKGMARKERFKHLLNPSVLRSSNENFPQSPVWVLGHSSQGDQVSSVALHLSL